MSDMVLGGVFISRVMLLINIRAKLIAPLDIGVGEVPYYYLMSDQYQNCET